MFRTNKMPDLQEKSASGAVAAFNTALAMPLASCNIAVNAWQEGSGDPSPSNVRAIHGFSEVNITHTHKNLFGGLPLALSFGNGVVNPASYSVDETNKTFTYSRPTTTKITEIYSKFNPNTQYTIIWTAYQTTETSGNNNSVFIRYTDGTRLALTVSNTEKQALIFTTAQNKSVEALCVGFGNGNNITAYYDECGIFEGVVTAEDYELYNGNTYTIQLGQEVYGGVYDSVSGQLKNDTDFFTFTGADNENWSIHSSGAFTITVSGTYLYTDRKSISNEFVWVDKYTTQMVDGEYKNTGASLYFKSSVASTVNEWKEWLNSNPLEVILHKTTPTEIQLTPTQIETLIGNNTIFADTGDTSLTFKDLDIAKRGNFREVFKLPS